MENYFGNNLRVLRNSKGFTLAEMASNIGLTASQLNNYELGNSFPKFLDLVMIAKYLEISESDIIHKEIKETHPSSKTKSKKDEGKAHPKAHPYTHPNDKNQKEQEVNETLGVYNNTRKANIYDFSTAAAAGEAMILLHDDKNRQEADYFMPNLGAGIHIRCPIGGDSMHSTIKDGDKVIATLVTDIKEIRQGHIYAVIDKEDGLVCKRLYWDGENTIELVSDNEIYKPYKRHLKDVSALFRVREVHTTDLRPYWEDLRKDMRSMRNEINDLKRKMK